MGPSLGSNPLSQSFYGLASYIRGLSWLNKNRKYLFLLFLPTALGLMALTVGWGYFFAYHDNLIGYILPEAPEAWYWMVFYWIGYAIAYLGFMAVSLLACLLVTNIITSPVYDLVSIAIEKDLTGRVEEITLGRSLLLIGEELKKALFIIIISVTSFIATSFIPGANILSLLITAFLVGWDFYDYPLARRGWHFKQRLKFVFKDVWSVTSFGLWLVIPFLQFLLMPLAIAGGTLITIDSLKKNSLLNEES